jgi:hypothetical protein
MPPDTSMRWPLIQRLSSDECRDHGSDVLRLADAAERRHARHVPIDGGIVANHAAAEIGGDRARRHGVDCDAARTQFQREVARQHLHRPPHGRVGRGVGDGEAGQSRGDIDDASAVVEQRQQLLDEGGVVRGTGVIDQLVEALDAEPAERLAHLADEAIELTDLARIEGEREGLNTGLTGERDDFLASVR